MRLSDNFTLQEFCVSQTAVRMGREIEPTGADIANLRSLCRDVLQPIRDHLTANIDPGIRMHITSGLRPVWLNNAIGGSSTSDHMYGRAADWVISGAPELFTLHDACVEIVGLRIPYDQVIYEGARWIHIGWRMNPRGEVLTAEFTRNRWGKRKTIYHRGLKKLA